MSDTRAALEQTLGDAFTLERQLTGGGMSTVYVARDNALNRRVVIKVLPAELSATVSVERFRREIMLSAALQHPHIVAVISSGEVDGLPYFIMPFIDGESLRTRLTRGPLAVREAVSIMRDVGRALMYAHSRDVVHRDIKPDNILLTGGAAVVTDFGVAKALAAATPARAARTITPGGSPATITAHGIAIGTPGYMSPEQAAGDSTTDHRADLYALGIVSWEMLAGTAPFQGVSPRQVMTSQLIAQPPPISSRRYDVPSALARIVDHLLQKEPRDRPKNAAELVRLLDHPDVINGPYAESRSKSRRRLASMAALGIVVAAVIAYLLLR